MLSMFNINKAFRVMTIIKIEEIVVMILKSKYLKFYLSRIDRWSKRKINKKKNV